MLLLKKVRAGVPVAALLIALAWVQSAFAQMTPPSPPPPPPGGGGNTPPVIISLGSEQLPGKKYRIFGTVADNTPQSCSVTVSGSASGSAGCDANGNFSKVFDVAIPGPITVVAYDGSLHSDSALGSLSNDAPTITVMAVGGPNNTWTFSGTVTDEAPAGLTVTLSGPPGVQGASATVQAGGSWSITLTLTPGASGNVTATVTDWYGLSGSGYTSF
jgi:hypothetical protein